MPKSNQLRAEGSNFRSNPSEPRPFIGRRGSHQDSLRANVAVDPMESEQMAREFFLASEQPDLSRSHRDYRTGTLTAAVIILSMLLGWMVGRAGWNMAVGRPQGQSTKIPEEILAATQVTSFPFPVSLSHKEAADPPESTLSSTGKRASISKARTVEAHDALVMYEHGKVVFRASPSEVASQAESTGSSGSRAGSQQIPPLATNSYLLTRVVPNYPEGARRQRVQGPVVMSALVGTDGSVQEVKVISGDPQLVQAATDAVRQWRFHPHRLKGNPVEFETQITVNFSLP